MQELVYVVLIMCKKKKGHFVMVILLIFADKMLLIE